VLGLQKAVLEGQHLVTTKVRVEPDCTGRRKRGQTGERNTFRPLSEGEDEAIVGTDLIARLAAATRRA